MPDDLTAFSRLGLCLVISYSTATAFWVPLRQGGRLIVVSAWLTAVFLTATLFLIPSHQIGLRALAAFLTTDLSFKLIDAARRSKQNRGLSDHLSEWLAFLVPFPTLLVTGEEWQRCRPPATPINTALLRTFAGGVPFLLCWVLLFWLQKSPVLKENFPLDHATKVVLFVVAIECVSLLSFGLERLAGFEPRPLMNRIWMARTPAEFWARYNTRVHVWLLRNIYRPADGLRHPVRGVVLVFLVSAFLHEVAFDVALSRIDGTQFAFFTLQIPAVLASPALERFAKRGGLSGKIIAHATTIGWFIVSSTLFFVGVSEIFPFLYTSGPVPPPFGAWSPGFLQP